MTEEEIKEKTLKEKGKTMMEVKLSTTKRLKKIKLTKREDYDSVINRILDFYNSNVREIGRTH